jgi:non-heme chloroperoxidase
MPRNNGRTSVQAFLYHALARRALLFCTAILAVAITPALCSATETKGAFFTTSDGVKLHYLEAGKGPAIVFVPGWSMPAWIWNPQIRYFSKHFHVVALDPRAQGDSDKVNFGNYPERRARDIKELIGHLHLAPALLVGWSLAVPELLSYAEQFGGGTVKGYVLVDGFVWSKQDPQFITAMIGTYRQVQTDRAAFTDKFVRGMFRHSQPEAYLKRLVAASLRMPPDLAVSASVSSVSRADWSPAIGKLDRPVLVMCEASLKAMAAEPITALVPSARVELFENAGHALFVDDADHFNKTLQAFIDGLPSAAPPAAKK